MAINMEALLKIRADVQGEGAIQGLATKLGGLQNTAAAASGGFKGLAGAAGGVIGPLGALGGIVSGMGLVAMGKSAIDAADEMNDMAQKTGVPVEMLSKLEQAAEKSGTNIESVSAAMIKFNKGLSSGKAQEALTGIGISATDAAGKLKPTDQIMMEVADKFKTMPDGANKTALAMALFGKSGADMIPMLNGGRESIESLSATMTTKFAQAADAFNDKMVTLQTKFAELGVSVGTVLLPILSKVVNELVYFSGVFSKLPGPVQALVIGLGALVLAFVVLAPAISAVVTIAGALAGLQLGATIAGWLGVAGPAIAGITALFTGLLTFITGTLLPGLLAVFSGPVGWTVLAVAAVVAMCIYFREPIMEFFSWLGGAIGDGLNALWQWGEPIREFWIDAFSTVGDIVKKAMDDVGNVLGDFVKWLWNWGAPIRKFWGDLWNSAVDAAQKAFSSLGGIIKDVFRGILQYIANQINKVGSLVNVLIDKFNTLSLKVGGPIISRVPILSIPAFAQGGIVTRPTLAMVGEGGEPEYIIPESKMAAAASNYLAGQRGGGIIPTNGGNAAAGPGTPTINITTGPVMEINGERYVSMADMEKAMRQTAEAVLGRLRTPAARLAIGVR